MNSDMQGMLRRAIRPLLQRRLADMIDAERRILVSRTADVVESSGRVSCNLSWILRDLLNHPPRS